MDYRLVGNKTICKTSFKIYSNPLKRLKKKTGIKGGFMRSLRKLKHYQVIFLPCFLVCLFALFLNTIAIDPRKLVQ